MADSLLIPDGCGMGIDAVIDGSVSSDCDDGDPSEPPAAHDDVHLTDASGSVESDDQSWLVARAAEIMELLETEGHQITRLALRLVNDEEMADAHVRFSGVEGTTDVLSFHSVDVHGLEMDILACVDEAGRRANERGHALRNEILLYVLHGVLHACGFDDGRPEEFERMHAEEDRILEAIGVGAVFRSEGEA